jgi:hypothetical protein
MPANGTWDLIRRLKVKCVSPAIPSACKCRNIRYIPLHITRRQLLVGRHGMTMQCSVAVAAIPILWA